MDTEENGYAAGLSLCVTRDGQGKPTADFLPAVDNTLNLGSASFRWTGLNGDSIANGTFTGVGVGFTAGTNFACTWARIGKLALLNIGANLGVSNSTSFSITGLPAAIQPASLAQVVPLGIARNNGADVSGAYALIIASTTIQLGLAGSLSGWAGAGNKGFGNTVTVAYLLS